MTILHIAHVDESRLAGVNVAVPAIVQSQEREACVGFLNLTNVAVPETATQLTYSKGMRLRSLPEPFCKPDLIVFHEVYRPAFLPLSRQARTIGIPYVIVPHASLTVSAQKHKGCKKTLANYLLFGKFIRGAAAVQCLSDWEMVQTECSPPRFVCTNGIQLGPVKTKFSESGMTFAYIGRLAYHMKGLDLMMKALIQSRDFLIKHGCRVDLYGPDEDGTREKLIEQRKKGALEDVLTIHDPVSGEEKAAALDRADCFLQTSRNEGMSMGILEALSWGLPCLVTEETGLAQLLEETEAGWGCKGDPASIAAAIQRAVLERDTLSRRSANARTLAEKRFSWRSSAAEALTHYQRIISQSKSK